MHKLYTLRETLCEELEKVAKKDDITTNDLDTIDKLAHSIKNLDKIINDDNYSHGYSGRRYMDSYDYSYARRGRDGDSDGRYNEGRSRDYARDYSRDDNHRMADKLRDMMGTSNDRDKEAIMRVVHQLEND